MSTLMEAVGVSKAFPGVKALDNVSFGLNAGEVHALVGENGAGKSTLMKLLSGVYIPDSGSFFLNGKQIEISGPRDAQELGISIIHQELNLMPDLTVAQNIFMGREKRYSKIFLSEKEQNQRAVDLFKELGIDLDPTELVSNLTVARQQMVEIARALSYNAQVLIMDEPTAALNDAEVATLFELIERFKSPTTGVIYISHRMDELKVISDRISVLRDGTYVGTKDSKTTPMSEIISMMVGRTVSENNRPEKVNTSPEVVLSVEGLSTKKLLKNVSFDLHKGEILGFAGLMGAGRTEIGRAIVAADPKSAGVIKFNGTVIDPLNPAEAANIGIGYLSEDRKRYGVLLNRDVAENVALSSMKKFQNFLGFVKDELIATTASSMVRTLKIKTPTIRQNVGNLSGGNQQKVVIAKWLVKDCDVLIFDEPTRGIDVGAKEEIYDLLNKLASEGKSIIMISSELPEVLRLSHRIAVMCEGTLTAIMPNAEATQESIMKFATTFDNEGKALKV
ncbi:MAG: sugar ABC transporter ATP-binding protein [Aurantimicrobium sp.]|uniref:sugar ABC transporter ATP-binding protein n=1 Tax=Aurantimicrobium sp. TaxID=1930784 RepID=UPI002FC7DA10